MAKKSDHSLSPAEEKFEDVGLAGSGEDDFDTTDDFEEAFKPPSAMEAPPAREGMTQKWIRYGVYGQADATNRNYAEKMGWRPRRADTVSEADLKKCTTISGAQFGIAGDLIMCGSLVLCEMSIRRRDQRNAFYQQKNKRQVDFIVGNHIDDANRKLAGKGGYGAIQMERSTKVTTRRPIIEAD